MEIYTFSIKKFSFSFFLRFSTHHNSQFLFQPVPVVFRKLTQPNSSRCCHDLSPKNPSLEHWWLTARSHSPLFSQIFSSGPITLLQTPLDSFPLGNQAYKISETAFAIGPITLLPTPLESFPSGNQAYKISVLLLPASRTGTWLRPPLMTVSWQKFQIPSLPFFSLSNAIWKFFAT